LDSIIQVVNQRNGQFIVESGKLANTFKARLIGLTTYKELGHGQGMIIMPCSVIHTFGMQFPIDVIFVSNDDEIVYAIKGMKPNRISPHIKDSGYIIEVPIGQIKATNSIIGGKLTMNGD